MDHIDFSCSMCKAKHPESELCAGMEEPLSKIEILIASLEQCLGWAKENLEEEIDLLRDCECFWELQDGREISNSVDFLALVEEAIAQIKTREPAQTTR